MKKSIYNPSLRHLIIGISIGMLCKSAWISAAIIHVPADQTSLQVAIDDAGNGDTIILEEGTYFENVHITKKLTVASSFLLDGDDTHIENTVIDGATKTVFTISGPKDDTTSLIGLTIQNGDDGIMAYTPVNLFNNIIQWCKDGIDYETGGSGTCKHNLFTNNHDDGIDLDGTLPFIFIENNIIEENGNDGIEIRLHSYSGERCFCRISNNRIYGSGEDGIQFIDYPDTTNRVYILEGNLIYENRMAGIGCMDNGESREDFRGAAIQEAILVFNNTIIGNECGICGGAGMIAINNIIMKSRYAGIKNLSGRSIFTHSVLYLNGTDQVNSHVDETTVILSDPKLSEDFVPGPGSPCIDKGNAYLVSGSDTLISIPVDRYNGNAPDIGAFEHY
jgi:hypothetical protein